MNLETALKALTITDDTILFVDIDQIRISQIENRDELPKGLLIVGVVGEPNVQSMTREDLLEILEQKDRALAIGRE
jgi:hypothetical protein